MPHQCMICNESFKYKKDYLRHYAKKSGCLTQEKVITKFKEANYLDPDTKKELEKKEDDKVCLLCNKKFNHVRDYEKHNSMKNTCVTQHDLEAFLKKIQETKKFNMLLHAPINGDLNTVNQGQIGNHNSHCSIANTVNHIYNFSINGVDLKDPEKRAKLQELLSHAGDIDKMENSKMIEFWKKCLGLLYYDPKTPENNVIAKTDKSRDIIHFMYKDKGYRQALSILRDLLFVNFEEICDQPVLLPEQRIYDEEYKAFQEKRLNYCLQQAIFENTKKHPEIAKKLKKMSRGKDAAKTYQAVQELIKEVGERKQKLQEKWHQLNKLTFEIFEELTDSDEEQS